jgi:DNA polymerase-3 subunit beta
MLTKANTYLGKDLFSITSQLNISSSDNGITVRSTNNEMGITLFSENVFVLDNDQISVSGSKLLATVKALSEGEITLSTKDRMLIVSQSRSRFKIPLFEDMTFPDDIDISKLNKLSIDYSDMSSSLKMIVSSIDSNNPKYELNGALVDISENGIYFASTDTRRLSTVNIESNTNENLQLIIPKKAISEIQKVSLVDINVFYDNSYLVVTTGDTKFFTKLINGKFPDFKRIIPTEFNHEFEFLKTDMSIAIKQVTAVSQELKITLKQDGIYFDSLSTDNNHASTHTEKKIDIESDIEINVNAQYLNDFFNSTDIEKFSIKINEPEMPFLVSSGKLNTVIMPIVSA